MTMIPSVISPITHHEILSAIGTIINRENRISAFEREFSEYVGSKNVLLTYSGRTALYLLLKAYGLKRGDEVIMPAYSCESVARLIIDMGYKLKFADVEKDTYNISVNDLNEKISHDTKAVIAIHMFGNPCEIDDIIEISYDRRAIVIEDAAQSIGAEYKGRKVGSQGDSGFFSLGEGKPIVTMNGGIIATNNNKILNRCIKIMEKFDVPKFYEFRGLTKLIIYYLISNPHFYNLVFRMIKSRRVERRNESRKCINLNNFEFKYTSMQAAVGMIQFSKLNLFNEYRVNNAEFLMKHLKDIAGVNFPKVASYSKPKFLRLPVFLENITEKQRRNLIYKLQTSGIDAPIAYPNSLAHFFFGLSGYPNTEELVKKTITLPTHPLVKKDDCKNIINILSETL